MLISDEIKKLKSEINSIRETQLKIEKKIDMIIVKINSINHIASYSSDSYSNSSDSEDTIDDLDITYASD